MDLKKILAKKHTPEEVSSLWTAYHATRSKGTGRGYLSATIPLPAYLKMTSLAAKYSSFLLPLPHPAAEPEAPQPAHEFHFLQWGFHETPPHPAQTPSLPFDEPLPPPPASVAPNPAYSTVLFTPLQEYKLRQAFAQPHMVLTHYTDLATTHGIVLMRGELTASPSSPEKFLLSQVDAQLLALGVQRFYLATEEERSIRRVEMLRKFHEQPGEFRWEDLLAFADPTS